MFWMFPLGLLADQLISLFGLLATFCILFLGFFVDLLILLIRIGGKFSDFASGDVDGSVADKLLDFAPRAVGGF